MPTRHVLLYGLFGLPLAFAALPVYVHLPRFYAEQAGVDVALLGLILLLTRLADACIDPWLGQLADRWPRRRLLRWACLPFVLGFVALFNPPADGILPWLVAALILTYLGFSAASVAYQAWGAALAEDSVQRTRLSAAREGFTLLGVLLAAAAPAWLASEPGMGTARLSWILPPLLGLVLMLGFSGLRSEGTPPAALPERGSLWQPLADPAFARLLIIFLVNGIAAALPATLFLFFVADVLGRPEQAGLLLALYFLAAALSMPFWVRVAERLGRVRAWWGAMGLAMAVFAGSLTVGPGDFPLFAAICLVSGLAQGADLAFPAAIAADLGARRAQAGLYFGLWNLVGKLSLAVAAGLALPLLASLGYQPGGSEGLKALSVVYAALPILLKICAASLLWRWRRILEATP